MNASDDCQVILFPLCDRRRVLLERLDARRAPVDPRREPRVDALIFAWLLELPETMNSADAARAVLAVLGQPRRRGGQGADPMREALETELLAIAERDRLSAHPLDNASGDTPPRGPRSGSASRFPRPRTGQRKTRSGRVFRD